MPLVYITKTPHSIDLFNVYLQQNFINAKHIFTAFLHQFGLHCVLTFSLNDGDFMSVIYLGLVVVFFATTVALVHAFEKLRGQS